MSLNLLMLVINLLLGPRRALKRCTLTLKMKRIVLVTCHVAAFWTFNLLSLISGTFYSFLGFHFRLKRFLKILVTIFVIVCFDRMQECE